MPTFPEASAELVDTPKALASGTELLTLIGCCATNADGVPRLYGSVDALIAGHGYCPSASYAASHFEETGKPVLFVPLPIVTQGTVGRKNTSGNTGSSVVDIVATAGGALEECDVVVTCEQGGTIGSSQILLGLSLDGGVTTKSVRLGTANSYTIPRVRLQLTFAAGTLVAGDTILTAKSTAPRWDQAGLALARTNLVAQQKQSRSWLIVGDLLVEQDAVDVETEVAAYDTSNDRFVEVRVQLKDRLPAAEMSRVQVLMTGNPNVTFAEVGATGDTITRAAGSFVTDGFAAGMLIAVSGSASNNFTNALITGVTATVLTLDTQDLVAEGPVGNVTISGTPGLTFAEVGATGDTITRAGGGSWLTDGFRAGDLITVAGTVSNNFSSALVTGVTATVLTLDTQDLTAEGIGSYGVTLTAGQTKAQHVAANEALFDDIDDSPKMDLGHGRGRKLCRVLGYRFRRPVQWAASLREYQHDVHIPCWRKSDGPLLGWDLEDTDGNLVEHDDRIDGHAATAARFTSFRTYGNGPKGAFITRSMTRALEGSQLLHTHNMHVANVACTIVQAETENFIGSTPTTDENGFATRDELNRYKAAVDSALELNLLRNVAGEGARCSAASYTPATNDNLNAPDAVLNGEVELRFRGTVVRIATKIKVAQAA